MATHASGSGLDSPATRFAYFSDLLGRRVVDAKGVFIGRLWDLSIQLPEPYPLVRQLWIRPRGPTELILMAQGEQVESWVADPIRLSARLSELRPSRRKDETEILLKETLLDKQVVDVSGAKVERVNDLHFLVVREKELVLAHIDVGLRSLVRRLGWQPAIDRLVRSVRPHSRYFAEEGLIG